MEKFGQGNATVFARNLDFDTMPEGECAEFWLPARTIAALVDPLESPPWGGLEGSITRLEIEQAIQSGNIVHDHVGPGEWIEASFDDERSHEVADLVRRTHLGRIAAFVLSMPDDAICLGVGMPNFGHDIGDNITVDDGNHRLAAAIYLDCEIRTSFTGEWSEFLRLFPDAVLAAPTQPECEPVTMAS